MRIRATSLAFLVCSVLACDADDPTQADASGDALDADAGTTPPGTPDANTPPTADAAASDGAILTVVSFNLLHGFPDFPVLDERTQIIADYINDNQPDLVALQEIGQTPTVQNRAEVLAAMTGYDWVWEKASGVEFVFEEGPGILSRWPITDSAAVELPHPGLGGFEVRKAVRGRIDTPYGPVNITSTHLTTQKDPTMSADQALAAYQLARGDATALPSFFAGDMNALPESLAMQMLRGEAFHAGVTGDLVDAWLAANPDDPGYTSTDAPERIDYVYVVPGTAAIGEVLSCEIILEDPVGGVMASDHLGVSCRIRLD